MRPSTLARLAAFAWSFGVIAVVLLSPLARTPAPPPPGDPVLLASAILRHAGRLSSSEIGEAVTIPVEVIAWRAILQSPDARDAFQDLAHTGTPAGKLYGLIGLQFTDRAAFARAAARLRGRGGEVEVQRGCIVITESINWMVERIEAGDWSALLAR